MPYSTDVSSLESYISNSLNSSDSATDAVVFLYKIITQLNEAIADIDTIRVNTNNSSNSTNQMTVINRLTDIATDLNSIVGNTDLSLTTLRDTLLTILGEIKTLLNTGKVSVDLDNIKGTLAGVLSNLVDIYDSAQASNANEESILSELGIIKNEVATLDDNDYTVILKPDGGINSNIITSLESIKNQLEALENANLITRNNIIITNQLLVDQPKIIHLVLNTAGEEYSYVLPIGTRRFSIKSRQIPNDPEMTIRYSYAAGIAGTGIPTETDGYYSIGAYVEDEEYDVHLVSPLPIYFSSNIAGAVVVIKYWGTSPVNNYAPASQIKLKNITLVNSNTEYMIQFPQDTKRFTIKMIDPMASDYLKIAYVPGVVALGSTVDGNSYTAVYGDGELIEPNLGLTSTTSVYLAGSRSGIEVGYEYWT